MKAKPFFRLPVLLALCFALQGCVVAKAADLAATTVLEAGKIAVKGTSAVVRAVIPDGKDKDKKADKSDKQPSTDSETDKIEYEMQQEE